jgi:hypothetical protein
VYTEQAGGLAGRRAVARVSELMASDAGGRRQGDLELVLHPVRLADWYATQSGRGVAVFERPSDKPSVVLRPPDEWGDRWAWNVREGAIYFKRT